MTNEQLAAMKELEEKATPGPWHVASAGIAHCPELGFVPDENRERSANRQFIAAARSFVPAAIAEIEMLRGLVEELTIPIRESDGTVWTHWGRCPTNGQPILFFGVQPAPKKTTDG